MNLSPLLASFGAILALLVGDEGLSANLTCAKPAYALEARLGAVFQERKES